MAMMAENIFLKIISGEIPATIEYADEHCLAFKDIHPQAPVHLLLIPRKPIRLHADLKAEDAALMGHLHLVAAKLAVSHGIGDGYRLVINNGEKSGQTVPHLHMHILGGRVMGWPPG